VLDFTKNVAQKKFKANESENENSQVQQMTGRDLLGCGDVESPAEDTQ